MLLIVFGAGASYDSLPAVLPNDHEFRPPLADQLFDNRPAFRAIVRRFPQCAPIIPLLHQRVGQASVEQLLQAFQEETQTVPERQKQLAAIRFYIAEALEECQDHWERVGDGQTNYVTLVDEVLNYQKQPTVIVTFNYDTMIEHAISSRFQPIDDLASYVRHRDLKLVKLHGSINWVRPFTPSAHVREQIRLPGAGDHARTIIDNVAVLELAQTIVIGERRWIAAGNVYGVPALAIPLVSKNNYECPPDHIGALHEALPEVTKVIVVGWKAGEEVFVRSLAEQLRPGTPIKVVAESDVSANATCINLESAGVRGQFRTAKDGFTGWVLNRGVRDFVKG